MSLSLYCAALKRARSESFSDVCRRSLEPVLCLQNPQRAIHSASSLRDSSAQHAIETYLQQILRELLHRPTLESKRLCPECCRRFTVIQLGHVEVEHCQKCQSFWLDSGELSALTTLSSDVPGMKLASRRSRFRCPVCSSAMSEFQFDRGTNLMVDSCPAGCGVYLQDEELSRAFQSAGVGQAALEAQFVRTGSSSLINGSRKVSATRAAGLKS